VVSDAGNAITLFRTGHSLTQVQDPPRVVLLSPGPPSRGGDDCCHFFAPPRRQQAFPLDAPSRVGDDWRRGSYLAVLQHAGLGGNRPDRHSSQHDLAREAHKHMTARLRLDRRMQWIRILAWTGFGSIVTGVLVMNLLGDQGTGLVVMLTGVAIAFTASMAGYYFAFRCTCCGGNLGPLSMHGAFIRMAVRVRFCPYCGACLEEESTAGSTPDDLPGDPGLQQTAFSGD
jgi:hypothetical protein